MHNYAEVEVMNQVDYCNEGFYAYTLCNAIE